MPLFSRLRAYSQRRQTIRLDALAQDLHLVTQRRESQRGNFVFPGPDMTAAIELAGQRVGGICYGVSPLQDRVYISELNILPVHQRCGLGLATLWRLWQQHQVPLTPMHEVGASLGFWSKARKRFAGAGAELTRDIRTGDQDAEQQRWQHLVPEPEHERLIREYWEWVAAERAAGRPAGPGIQ